jgi:hypothetical protein
MGCQNERAVFVHLARWDLIDRLLRGSPSITLGVSDYGVRARGKGLE